MAEGFHISESVRRGRTNSLIGGEIIESLEEDYKPDYLVRGIYIHSSGTLSFIAANDDRLDYEAGELASGILHPFEIKVLLADTTAKVTLGK